MAATETQAECCLVFAFSESQFSLFLTSEINNIYKNGDIASLIKYLFDKYKKITIESVTLIIMSFG